jgi:hypothetical protein
MKTNNLKLPFTFRKIGLGYYEETKCITQVEIDNYLKCNLNNNYK